MGHLHKKTKKAKILIIIKDFSFLILLKFNLLYFLMKTAVTIPLKKSRKRKINVFLRGSCFKNLLFFCYPNNSVRTLMKKITNTTSINGFTNFVPFSVKIRVPT